MTARSGVRESRSGQTGRNRRAENQEVESWGPCLLLGYPGWEPETALGGRSGDDGPWPPAEASLSLGFARPGYIPSATPVGRRLRLNLLSLPRRIVDVSLFTVCALTVPKGTSATSFSAASFGDSGARSMNSPRLIHPKSGEVTKATTEIYTE